MDYIFLKARAKINLALDVLDKRDDGYYNLNMIMQTLNLCDNIFIKKTEDKKIKIYSNVHYLPTNDKNLVYKAADLLIKKYNIQYGVRIDLKKNIPISAGLAGGSSDCAATLVAMNKLFDLGLGQKLLSSIGESLGSDVPFCVIRGTVWATGKGEKLKKLKKHPNIYVLLVRPPISISTAAVFEKFDKKKVDTRPNFVELIDALDKKDILKISKNLCNVLESVTIKQYPIIQDIKDTMLENGALGALMSGSGATVFGYYSNKKKIIETIICIKKNYENIKDIFITTIFNV